MNARHATVSMLLGGLALLLVACSVASGGSPTPGSTPSPTNTLSQAQLKYALLTRFGPISWCDPDFYPVAHEDEQVLAEQRLAEIQADAPTYAAIRSQLGIADDSDLTDADKLAIYREWKLLNAVQLTPAADGGAAFDLMTVTNEGLGEGVHTTGTIASDGTIAILLQEDSFLTSCPICLARGTMIDTPSGGVRVEDLRPGDLVWTLDAYGRRVVMPLSRTGSTPVPASHQVVHLVLADGRELWVSPGHKLSDGRTAGDLKPADQVHGSEMLVAELVSYAGEATFDILPDGATGYYWANGILLDSTLR